MKNMKLFAAVMLCIFGLSIASGFAEDKAKSGCCTKDMKIEKTSKKGACCSDKVSGDKKECSTKTSTDKKSCDVDHSKTLKTENTPKVQSVDKSKKEVKPEVK